MKKRILIPGPVELSPEVRAALSRPMMGHRTPDFSAILEECWEGLRYVYQTENDVLIITGSGTAAMDAAIASAIKEGDEVICIGGGKFGERFPKIVKAYGGVPVEVNVQWGRAVDPSLVEKAASESDAVAITLTHNETSTGVLHDASEIAGIARENDMLFIMDGITSIGGDDVRTDEWGVDICVAGSQKCLGAPPGLSFASVSEKAWQAIEENSGRRGFYLDLSAYRKSLGKRTTPFTPAVPLIYGLKTALDEIRSEGLENRIERHRLLARATREAAKAMNLELFAEESHASNTVTAIKIPEGLEDKDVRGRLKDEYGILLAGGQDAVKGRIFRIGHMGNVDSVELLGVLSALEMVLRKAGHDLRLGEGVRAAQEVLSR
ncbi:MAG: alanine--glyoxylate aminotransferase family protein [Methanobacteriota archaeon]|nr:MAG: alanine--glyoxylate aminotransferase family protein [Euryarchaeota archaeon]